VIAVVDAHIESGADIDEDGIDDAFELLNEVSEHVRTGARRSSLYKHCPKPSLLALYFRGLKAVFCILALRHRA
jgi:hypothetical protein